MSDILVRGLEPGVVERLKTRARRHRRSLQAEMRVIIEDAVSRDEARRDLMTFSERARRRLARLPRTDSASLIREDRTC